MQPCEEAARGSEAVEALLDMPLLQRLALHRAVELEINETDNALEIVQVTQPFLDPVYLATAVLPLDSGMARNKWLARGLDFTV